MPELAPAGGCSNCAVLERRLAAQDREIAALKAQVADLVARLNRTSRNSHRPPSTDPPGTVRPPKPPTGRAPGGQPGHPKHDRPLAPPDQVSEFVVVKPPACGDCGAGLRGADPTPARHQVTDVPEVQPHIVEYHLHALPCRRCGAVTRAALPTGVPRGAFGPRLVAFIALLTGAYHVSKRGVVALLADAFRLDLSPGAVAACEQQASAALAPPAAAVHAYVQAQPAVGADETGWREGRRRAWLWVATAALAAVFLIRPWRNTAVARELLGAGFAGVLGTDRWAAYRWVDLRRRQLCWAHLTRDFEAIAEVGGRAGRVGVRLGAARDRLFAWWGRFREGALTRRTFQTYVGRIRPAVGAALRAGLRSGHAKTVGMCREILKEEPALWTFARVPGVEPTNNAPERALRPAVLWRKQSFGTHSAAGSRFVERVLTAVTTLRLQRRHVLGYLTAACEAALHGTPVPSLLPIAAAARAS